MKLRAYFVLMMIITGSLLAQKGSIKGTIIDAKTKQPLIGANVIVKGTNFGAATNVDGYYEIKNVPENIYKLVINYVGYSEYIEPDIRVIRSKTFYVKEIELQESAVLSGEVVVSSGYFNEAEDMPVSNYTYTKQEIVRAPGAAGDIFRALESLPGVSSSGGEFSSFSVRGGTPKQNLILIDNIPFSNVSHFAEASGNEEIEGGRFSIFTTGLVDKANFQAGGFSSKYGGKSASLLDLKIKEGNRESFTINGTYDLLGWEANYDGPLYLLKNTGILFSARRLNFDNVFELIDEVSQGSIKMEDYILKITTDINKDHKLSLLGIYSGETSIRTPYHMYKGKALDERDLRDEYEYKGLLGLNWRYLTSSNSYLNTSIYYSNINQNQKEGRAYPDAYNGIVPEEKDCFVRNPIMEFDAVTDQYGIKSDFTYDFSNRLSLKTGFDLQYLKRNSKINMTGRDTIFEFTSNEILLSNDKFTVMDPMIVNSTYDKWRMESALYGEMAYKPIEKLHLNLGVRYSYDDISDKHRIAPRFSGSYKLNNVTAINFAAGIYYQLPELQDLAGDYRNHKLSPEKSTHYILGVSHYFNDELKLTIEGYYKNLSDLLVAPNSYDMLIKNSGKGYSYGVDVSLLKRFVDSFYGQINYSYGVCKLKDTPGESYYNSTFNQPHIFNILVGYQLDDNWSFSTKWKYATGRPRDEYIIHSDVFNDVNRMRYSKEITSENSNRYPAFHTLNLRIDYRTQFTSRFALIAFIDILNVYGRANVFMDSFNPINGKNDSEGLETFPTIGFRLEI